jgi:hypothetical protein
VASTEETIEQLLDRMKDPKITRDAFEEYERRIKTLRSLIQEQ